MSATATDYIAIAALLMLEDGDHPRDRDQLCKQFEQTYNWKCDEDAASRIVGQLEAWNALTVHQDKYASETLRMFSGTIRDTISKLSQSRVGDIILSGRYEGAPWFKRVFENQRFWDDLYREKGETFSPFETDVSDLTTLDRPIPASDRIVTLAHNQANELASQAEDIIKKVDTLNKIEGVDNLREVILGQLRAGRELIANGSFKVYVLETTLLNALRFLAVRYEKEVIGALASALLTALAVHLGMPH